MNAQAWVTVAALLTAIGVPLGVWFTARKDKGVASASDVQSWFDQLQQQVESLEKARLAGLAREEAQQRREFAFMAYIRHLWRWITSDQTTPMPEIPAELWEVVQHGP